MRTNNKGFSLIELAIGLAVVSVLILSVTVSAGIRDSARVQSAAQSVQALRNASENYIASGKLNYAGLTVDALKSFKLLPESFSASKSNPWGGSFDVSANPSDTAKFDVLLSGVPKVDADRLTAFFNNSAQRTSFDDTTLEWVATF